MHDQPADSTLRQRAAILAAALPALALSVQFFHVLFAPLAGDNLAWAVDAVLLLVLEFFMVHAGFLSIAAMSGERGRRIAVALGLGLFYLLFMGMFALFFEQRMMILGAAVLLTGRLWGAATRGEEELGERIGVSVFSVVLYLGVVAGTSAPEQVPAFGFTPEVLEQIRPAFGSQGGLWVSEPQRAVGGAALYFLANGLFELARLRHVRSGVEAEGGWTRIGTVDARIREDSVELRQSGAPGTLMIGALMGGLPAMFGVLMIIGEPASKGAGVFMMLAGPVLLAIGLWVIGRMFRNSTRKLTLLASKGRLEVRESWITGAPRTTVHGPEALERLELAASMVVNGSVEQETLRLRAPPDEVELIRGLRGRAESSMVRDLITSRVSGKPE